MSSVFLHVNGPSGNYWHWIVTMSWHGRVASMPVASVQLIQLKAHQVRGPSALSCDAQPRLRVGATVVYRASSWFGAVCNSVSGTITFAGGQLTGDQAAMMELTAADASR